MLKYLNMRNVHLLGIQVSHFTTIVFHQSSGFLRKQEQSNAHYFQRLPRSLKVKRKGWQGRSNSNAATPATRELPIYKEHYPECHALASITLKNTA